MANLELPLGLQPLQGKNICWWNPAPEATGRSGRSFDQLRVEISRIASFANNILFLSHTTR